MQKPKLVGTSNRQVGILVVIGLMGIFFFDINVFLNPMSSFQPALKQLNLTAKTTTTNKMIGGTSGKNIGNNININNTKSGNGTNDKLFSSFEKKIKPMGKIVKDTTQAPTQAPVCQQYPVSPKLIKSWDVPERNMSNYQNYESKLHSDYVILDFDEFYRKISVDFLPPLPLQRTKKQMVDEPNPIVAAICLIKDNVMLQHFPHAMEQVYMCFGYWIDHSRYPPVLLIDEEKEKFLRKAIRTNPFMIGIFDMLENDFNLTVLSSDEYYNADAATAISNNTKYKYNVTAATTDNRTISLVASTKSESASSINTTIDNKNKTKNVTMNSTAVAVTTRLRLRLAFYHPDQTIRTHKSSGLGYILRHPVEWNALLNLCLSRKVPNYGVKEVRKGKERDPNSLSPLHSNVSNGNGTTMNHKASESQRLQSRNRPPRIGILNRQMHRKIKNAEELASRITKAQNNVTASVIYFEGKTFVEQMHFFRQTDILISGHGAQLTGLPFMTKQLRSNHSLSFLSCKHVLELYPNNYFIPYYFGSLVVTSGMRHSYMYFDDPKNSEPRIIYPWQSAVGGTYIERSRARSAQFCPKVDGFVDAVLELIADWYKCRESRWNNQY